LGNILYKYTTKYVLIITTSVKIYIILINNKFKYIRERSHLSNIVKRRKSSCSPWTLPKRIKNIDSQILESKFLRDEERK